MKKTLTLFAQLFAVCVLLISFNSCDGGSDTVIIVDDYDQHDYPPFYVSDDHRSATLDGTIDSNSFSQFNQMLFEHPGIEVIYFDQAIGSLDDDATVQIGRRIRNLNLDTHILSGGVVTTGALDIFLAGFNRTRGFNTSIGVQSWIDSFGNEATDFPEDSNIHNFYIDYYLDIGLGIQFANDFYFFSINAADPFNLYFLNESDIQYFQIFTE
jgi:hypothetical protein